jgi:hypothetical protein
LINGEKSCSEESFSKELPQKVEDSPEGRNNITDDETGWSRVLAPRTLKDDRETQRSTG